jgi:hypothetical protein
MLEPPVQADQSAVERVRNITLIIHITFLGALTRGSFVNYTTDLRRPVLLTAVITLFLFIFLCAAPILETLPNADGVRAGATMARRARSGQCSPLSSSCTHAAS